MTRATFVGLIILSLPPAPAAQTIPANARPVSGGKGWACNKGFVERANECIALAEATDDEVRQYLITESIGAYSGSCPCPYHVDRAGRRCGARSAYSRPGGRAPLRYPTDVSDEQVKQARARTPESRTSYPHAKRAASRSQRLSASPAARSPSGHSAPAPPGS
jgi:hypothetical protein